MKIISWLGPLCAIGLLHQAPAQEAGDSTIKLSPAKITIGALSYGADDERVLTKRLTLRGMPADARVTHVDLSHAAGVAVAAQQRAADGWEIDLAINLKQFTDQQPFGKFIKKLVRLETDSATQPQFVVPVIGWLAVNETERNFSHYLFNGAKRWQGIWGTPNIAGMVASGLIVFLAGCCAWLGHCKRAAWLRYGLAGILALAALAATIGLALTYSRGSWVAFVAGILTLTVAAGRLRQVAVGALTVFIITLCFLPSGLKRVESYAKIEADKSIAHRLKLWIGAAQIMAEHPLRGVGKNQFGAIFARDYQTFQHTVDNSTAVSDYFTLGAERGLLTVGSATGLLGFLLWYSLREGRRRRQILQLTLAATLVTLLVSSVFSTLAYARWYQYLFGGSVLGLLGFLAGSFYRSADQQRRGVRLLLQAGGGVLAGLAGFGTLSMVSLKWLPTKSSVMDAPVAYRLITPRHQPAKGTVIYLTKPGEDIAILCHATLRPLAALGWQVVWSGAVTEPEQVFALAAECQRQFPNTRLYLAGHDAGGKLAWQTVYATVNNGVFAKAAGYGFLDHSLLNEPPRPAVPFLIYQSLYDDQCSANPAILAQRKTMLSRLPLTVVLSEQEPARFSAGWTRWLQTLDQYLANPD